jgi:hypothetical protein
MADAQARKAAIKKASSQVRTDGVYVRRSSSNGEFRSARTAGGMSVGRAGNAAKSSPKKSP